MRFLNQIDRGAIEEMLGRDEYFWLDLDAPSEADVDTLDDLFHWHPLAMEDLRKKGQRPKLEDYDQYMFLVYYGAAAPEGGEPPAPDAPVAAAPARGERVDLEEVHAFVSGSYLVTVHDGDCTSLDEVRKRLDQQPPSPSSSSSTASSTPSPTASSRCSRTSKTGSNTSTRRSSPTLRPTTCSR